MRAADTGEGNMSMRTNDAQCPTPVRDSGRDAALTVLAPVDGTAAVLPAGFPLREAAFIRHRDHLLVRAAGRPDVIVPRFFGDAGQTTLVTRNGVEMSRHMVLLMLNVSKRVERVLSELAMPAGREL